MRLISRGQVSGSSITTQYDLYSSGTGVATLEVSGSSTGLTLTDDVEVNLVIQVGQISPSKLLSTSSAQTLTLTVYIKTDVLGSEGVGFSFGTPLPNILIVVPIAKTGITFVVPKISIPSGGAISEISLSSDESNDTDVSVLVSLYDVSAVNAIFVGDKTPLTKSDINKGYRHVSS